MRRLQAPDPKERMHLAIITGLMSGHEPSAPSPPGGAGIHWDTDRMTGMPLASGGASVETRERLWTRRATGYGVVLALLVVSYGLCATQPSTDPSPWAFLPMLATVAVVFSVTEASRLAQRVSWVVLSLAGLAAILAGALGADGPVLAVALSAASMVALLVAPWVIIAHQVTRRGLDLEALLAAVTAYILVGMFFAFVYNLMSQIAPDPLFGSENPDSLGNQLFFSFTALTTTGYGNLVPAGTGGQAVAVAEGITGQLFLITAVARIMRGASARRGTPTPT